MPEDRKIEVEEVKEEKPSVPEEALKIEIDHPYTPDEPKIIDNPYTPEEINKVE